MIRVASVPTRAVIRDTWHKSLSYSVATSPNGVNVMTSVCHQAKLGICNFFRKIPKVEPTALVGANSDTIESQTLEQYMGSAGAKTEDLHTLGEQLSSTRRLRSEWRERASGSNITDKSAYDAIKAVLGGSDAAEHKKYANALMPNYRQAALNYNPAHVLKWAIGQPVEYKESPIPGLLKYREIPSTGSAQRYDHAWIVVKESGGAEDLRYNLLGKDMVNGSEGITPAKLFDYHDAGIVDTLMLLEAPEAKRLCPEMPRNSKQSPHYAFADQTNNVPNKESTVVALRDYMCADGTRKGAAMGEVVDCRVEEDEMHSSKTKIHGPLDIITNRGRLPALQPYTSTRIINCSPIRRQKESGIEINAVAAYEHIAMVMEASINCSKVVGYTGLQENPNRCDNLSGLSASSNGGAGEASDATMTRLLPFCNDLVQINWSMDLAQRQYIDGDSMDAQIAAFNAHLKAEGLSGEIDSKDMPQQYMPCMGFPLKVKSSAAPAPAAADEDEPRRVTEPSILQLVSLPVQKKATTDAIEVSTASNYSGYTDEDLFDLVATHNGRRPTAADITAYRRTLVGDAYMYDVEGDLNDYSTWQNWVQASMLSKGNAIPTGDTGMQSLLDAELMLWCRLVERKAQKEGTAESAYGIDVAWGQTYSAVANKKPGDAAALMEPKLVNYKKKRTGAATASAWLSAPVAKKPCQDKSSGKGGPSSSVAGLEDARDE